MLNLMVNSLVWVEWMLVVQEAGLIPVWSNQAGTISLVGNS